MKIPENIKAVIFDVDELLLDTEHLWFKTHNEFLRRRNYVYKDEMHREITGLGHKEVSLFYKQRFALPNKWEEIGLEFRGIFYSLLTQEIQLMDGARVLVEQLYKKRYKLAVATGGYSRDKITGILKDLDMKKYFSVIVSGDEVERGKPYPDIYLETAKQLNVSPQQCIVLEDAMNGILAAKKAKMMVFGVNKDEKMREELVKAGADKVLTSLTEII